MINKLIDFAIHNRLMVIIFAVILTVFGIISFQQLPVDVYPDLNAPIVSVIAENPGMAPEDVEMLITFPLETAFNSLPFVYRVRSNSSLGISKINIDFEYGTDIYFARQLVTEKLQMITQDLPDYIKTPFIGPISSMFADAIEFTIKGGDLYEMRDWAEWDLKPRLQTVRGVSNVVNMGGLLKQYHVLLNPDLLLQYDLRANDIVDALKLNNRNAGGGFIVHGAEERIIQGIGLIQTIDDIKAVVIKTTNGVPLTIGDVASVQIGAYIRRGTAGESGEEVVIVTVQNQYGANAMKTIEGVLEVLEDVQSSIPQGWEISQFYNQLDMITKSVNHVTGAIIFGAFLVILVLALFFANVRSTFVVAVSIPLSAVFAFIFFRFFGLSINIMTLGGLAIGLGMIVDSSIIMAENIFRHVNEGNHSFIQSVKNGAKEVGNPIFHAILILLAVFAPIFTLQGIEGKMFIPLTFAVSAAVLGSLIISITITPVLAILLFKKQSKTNENRSVLNLLKPVYGKMIQWSAAHTKILALICAAVCIAGILAAFGIGSEFMPEMDESSLLVDILLPPETSLEESSRIAANVAARLSELPEIERVVRATGMAEGTEHTAPVNLTHTNCVLVPKEKRNISIDEIKEKIRNAVSGIPGVQVQINAPLQHRINHIATGIESDIAVKVFGEEINQIVSLSEQINHLLEDIPGVRDLYVEQITGIPQIQIRFNRQKLARYGLNIDQLSNLVEIALKGVTATELIQAQRRYDIYVHYQEAYRDTEEKIRNLLVYTPSGHRIPISEIADITESAKPSVIRRENALRRGVIQCNAAGSDIGGVVREIKIRLQNLDMPEGYFYTFGGTYESQSRAMRQLTWVVIFTLLIVFSLLIIDFQSVRQAMLILINIPLALSGGILILFFTGLTLSVPSIVGFIALIGIAVQDGIVLVNHINRNAKITDDILHAVIKAGQNKIRPVLMTTFTTILGLAPLAIRNVTGSEIQKPLAIVIIFGLFISTILTLIVLPSFYIAFERKRDSKDQY